MRQLYAYVANESTRSNGSKNLWQKSAWVLFKTSSLLFHLVHFINVSECFWSSKRLYLTLDKEKKRKLLSSVHVPLKRDIREF